MDKLNSILTIAIPTYNRAVYLRRCLDTLIPQIKDLGKIEILVFDNASTDDTEEICKTYTSLPYFKYFRSITNIGPDHNISQAYYRASGKYVHVFGDDDVFLPGYIDFILPKLEVNDYGCVFLDYYEFSKDFINEKPANYDQFSYQYDKNIFEVIRSRIGFISAYIINKEFINKQELIESIGSNLNHVELYTKAICNSSRNLYVSKYFIGQQVGNSSGFNYFKVFAQNQFGVLNKSSKGDKIIIELVFNELFITLFPMLILKIRMNMLENFDKNPKKYFEPWAANILSYRMLVAPILNLPIFIAVFFFVPIKIISIFAKLTLRRPKNYLTKF
jgi:abequosyltransferase